MPEVLKNLAIVTDAHPLKAPLICGLDASCEQLTVVSHQVFAPSPRLVQRIKVEEWKTTYPHICLHKDHLTVHHSSAVFQTIRFGTLLAHPWSLPSKIARWSDPEEVVEMTRLALEMDQNETFDLSHPVNEAFATKLARRAKQPVHALEGVWWTPYPIDQIFSFFEDAKNLEKITPPTLRFKVLSKLPNGICEGTKIWYCLLIHKLPCFWQSEIIRWQPGKEFTDIQRHGPYRYWHHRHWFEEKNGGTLLGDRVEFQLPLGKLGEKVLGKSVIKDVNSIFTYRNQIIEELFG